jgi:predicted lipoprotein with Yx(FWY)xxD motif
MRILRSLSLFAAALVLAACASMGGAPTKVSDGVLANEAGMTLYTFDNDPAGGGKSVCNGPCATNWPPLLAAEGASASGDYSIVTRDDGKKQWAYKGKPLYLWVQDKKPGDRTGDGFRNVWRVAKP